MRYPEKMDRPLSDDDRRWLKENNFGHIADQFDREDGVGQEVEDDAEEVETRSYGQMTVDELKTEIARRNKEILADDPEAETISTDGKKADLIARLKEDDAAMTDTD